VTHAVANVVGNINGQEFGVSRISANIARVDSGSRMNATLTDLPPAISKMPVDCTRFSSLYNEYNAYD